MIPRVSPIIPLRSSARGVAGPCARPHTGQTPSLKVCDFSAAIGLAACGRYVCVLVYSWLSANSSAAAPREKVSCAAHTHLPPAQTLSHNSSINSAAIGLAATRRACDCVSVLRGSENSSVEGSVHKGNGATTWRTHTSRLHNLH